MTITKESLKRRQALKLGGRLPDEEVESMLSSPKKRKSITKGVKRTASAPGTSWMELALSRSKPEKEHKKFRIAQCPRCGKPQVTQAQGHLTCKSCEARTKYISYKHRKRTVEVKFRETDNARAAGEFCKHWSECLDNGTDSLREITRLFLEKKE